MKWIIGRTDSKYIATKGHVYDHAFAVCLPEDAIWQAAEVCGPVFYKPVGSVEAEDPKEALEKVWLRHTSINWW